MTHARWIAPAALLAGLASAPSLAHGGAVVPGGMIAVGIPPVSVDVGDVHVVVGAPPPPPVVIVQEPPPPQVVVVREVVREAPRSTVVVYPRHRPEPVFVQREIVVVEAGDRCDHPGKHKGHHKHEGKHHGKHGRGDDHGYWR